METRTGLAGVTADDVPLPLRAGPCVETWAFDFADVPPDDRSEKLWRRQRDDAAVKRFRDARRRWLLSVGIDDRKTENMRPAALLVRPGAIYAHLHSDPVASDGAWSFADMSDLTGRAAWLEDRGLPGSWTPTPATPEDFG